MPKKLDNVRDEIIKVALKMFLEEDISKISIRKIAIKSRISIGTIYNYFPSKEDLIKEVIKIKTSDILRQIQIEIDKEKEIKEKVKAFYFFTKQEMLKMDNKQVRKIVSTLTEYPFDENESVINKVNIFQSGLLKILREKFNLDNDIKARIFACTIVWSAGINKFDFEDVWVELSKLL